MLFLPHKWLDIFNFVKDEGINLFTHDFLLFHHSITALRHVIDDMLSLELLETRFLSLTELSGRQQHQQQKGNLDPHHSLVRNKHNKIQYREFRE